MKRGCGHGRSWPAGVTGASARARPSRVPRLESAFDPDKAPLRDRAVAAAYAQGALLRRSPSRAPLVARRGAPAPRTHSSSRRGRSMPRTSSSRCALLVPALRHTARTLRRDQGPLFGSWIVHPRRAGKPRGAQIILPGVILVGSGTAAAPACSRRRVAPAGARPLSRRQCDVAGNGARLSRRAPVAPP
jgi:hypothetical protein